jgi:hypothetical protein
MDVKGLGGSKNSENLHRVLLIDALTWIKISEFLEKFRNLMKNHNLTNFTLLSVIFNPTIRLN